MRGKLAWVAALFALAVLLLAALALLRGVTGAARVAASRGASEPDPMFAEPAERVTRPPDALEGEAPVVSGDDDPSRDWVYETLTPVEQTAEELGSRQ